jgi:hypothetical protein
MDPPKPPQCRAGARARRNSCLYAMGLAWPASKANHPRLAAKWRQDMAAGALAAARLGGCRDGPPVFCPLVALWAARGHNVRMAIDLHSGGLNDPSWRWSFGLMRWAIRQAATVIVTNPDLLEEQDIGHIPVQIIQDRFWIEDEIERG